MVELSAPVAEPGIRGLRFACQTYSWQMSIDRYRGEVAHMTAVAAAAGFTGFEPEVVMLGDGWDVATLSRPLEAAGLELAALVLAEPWLGAAETPAERARADAAIAAVAALPGSRLLLVPLPSDRHDLARRQHETLDCLGAVATRARDAGVACSFHPNSPAGSLFRTADDYRRLADLLPPGIGFTPDLGHIARGGMDPVAVVAAWGDRVDHVHVKDVAADGTWAPTGEGVVDIVGVLALLSRTGFDGWVTFEDESPAAEADPDRATLANGAYVRQLLEEES